MSTLEKTIDMLHDLLMGGEMSLKDRAEAAYRITWAAGSVGQEELDKIETVLYIMADKFLEPAVKKELMEVVGMTELGQLLVNRGIEQGMVLGKEEKMDIAQNLIGHK